MKNVLIFDFNNDNETTRYILNKFECENNNFNYTFMFTNKENFNNGNINSLNLNDISNENTISLIEKIYKILQVLNNCGSYELVAKTVDELKVSIENYKKFLNRDHILLVEKTEQIFNEIKQFDNNEKLEEICQKFNNAISDYKISVQTKKDQDINEVYFNKFIDNIQYKYIDNLYNDNKVSPIKIIHLCLENNMFIQAIIFYIEWTPQFLIKNKYLTVSKKIQEECSKKGSLCFSWSVYFLKYYQPKNILSDLTIDETKQTFKSNDNLTAIMQQINGRNKKLFEFLQETQIFINSSQNNLVKNLIELEKKDPNNPVYILINSIKQKDLSYEAFIKKTYQKTSKFEQKIISSFANHLSKSDFKEIFNITDTPTEDGNSPRRKVMEHLLKHGDIKINFPEEHFLDYVRNYDIISQSLRNKIAHGAVNDEIISEYHKYEELIINALNKIDF